MIPNLKLTMKPCGHWSSPWSTLDCRSGTDWCSAWCTWDTGGWPAFRSQGCSRSVSFCHVNRIWKMRETTNDWTKNENKKLLSYISSQLKKCTYSTYDQRSAYGVPFLILHNNDHYMHHVWCQWPESRLRTQDMWHQSVTYFTDFFRLCARAPEQKNSEFWEKNSCVLHFLTSVHFF